MTTAEDLSPTLRNVLIAGSLMLAITLGVRHAFGIFLVPMSASNGWEREVFAMAIAVQNLMWGITQPFVGRYADRHGAKTMMIAGGLLYALGLLIMATQTSSTALILGTGVLIGIGLSGTTFPVVFGAISKVVPAERRSLALGISMSVGSLGQFVLLPVSLLLIESKGWTMALGGLFFLTLLTIPLAMFFGTRNSSSPAASVSAPAASSATPSAYQTIRFALAQRAFQLLCAGFFVCGFHVVFISTHLPGFLQTEGLSATVGTTALALIGLFNIAGSYYAGLWGGKYPKPILLAAIYASRAVAISLFLFLPISAATVYVFSAMMGLLWLSTVPLTNGSVASIFGVANMSMLGGLVFFFHQVGAFLGGWLGGLAFDATGSYDIAWTISIGLGVVAALINLPIKEQPVEQPCLETTAR